MYFSTKRQTQQLLYFWQVNIKLILMRVTFLTYTNKSNDVIFAFDWTYLSNKQAAFLQNTQMQFNKNNLWISYIL